jgi:hypothetical protein
MKKILKNFLAGLFLILAIHEGAHVAEEGAISFLLISSIFSLGLGILVADRLCISHNHGWEKNLFLLLVIGTGAAHSAVDGIVFLGTAGWIPLALILAHEAIRQTALIGALRANGFTGLTSVVSVTGVWVIVVLVMKISGWEAPEIFHDIAPSMYLFLATEIWWHNRKT